MNCIGVSLPRREDSRLLQGKGLFVADVRIEGTVHAAMLRSPHAHAAVRAIDASAIERLPGVFGFWSAQDLGDRIGPLTRRKHLPSPKRMVDATGLTVCEIPKPIVTDRPCYAGEIVGVVVARDRAVAEDALDRIHVDYEPLPSVLDPEAALSGAGPVHVGCPDNITVKFHLSVGDPHARMSNAPVVVRRKYYEQRYAGVPLETRGALADWRRDRLTIWSSTQVSHFVQAQVAACLGEPIARIHVVSPDVGGGFGPKCGVYAEEVLVAWLSRHLARPVRWIEDRCEHFVATYHSRDQIHEIEVGVDGNGRILAIKDRFIMDNGAYNFWDYAMAFNTATHLPGPYKVEHYTCEGNAVFTNKVPNAPYRGAGRPDAALAMECTLDEAARRMGIDPLEMRRRNLVEAAEMPYTTGRLYRDDKPMVYDSGDYPAALQRLAQEVDYDGFRRRQAEERRQGVSIGLGVAGYVEGTGVGPFEGGVVRLQTDGRFEVCTGACPQGQGHETTLAQICAERLGVSPDDVTVITGDTDRIARGIGTFASRSAVTAGNAVSAASDEVARSIRAVAAERLEVSPEDLEIVSAAVRVRGVPGRSMGLGELAATTRPGQFEAISYWEPPTVTCAYAFHAAEVEVDRASGRVDLRRYVVVHDAGRVINPMIVDGQVAGGVAQGIGGALYEDVAYGPSGQPRSGTLMDYLLPGCLEVPPIQSAHVEIPSPLNPLGVKGLGEGGAIGPPAAIANAIADALGSFDAPVIHMPLTPERVWNVDRHDERSAAS